MPKLPKRTLSPKGEKILGGIENQLTDIAAKYGQFKFLYLSGEDNLKTMRRVAMMYFEYAGESMFRDILLSIARLCDPAYMGSNEDLAFERLAIELPEPHKTRFLKRLGKLKKRIKHIKLWRNKHLAHNNLEHSLKDKKLPKIGYNRVTSYVEDATKLLNIVVHGYKREVYTGYNMVMVPRGASDLISHLEQSV